MFYENEPNVLVDDHLHPIAAVEEVETINPSPPVSNQNLIYDPNIIVIDNTQSVSNANVLENASSVTSTTPQSRKRTKSRTPLKGSSQKKLKDYNEDNDDGSMCPICLDAWEITGEHRLVALKCGHLFGESCIRRWMLDHVSMARNCPSCKRKASLKELRYIYAKRVSAIDKTELYENIDLLEKQKALNHEQQKTIGLLRLELNLEKERVRMLAEEVETLKKCTNIVNDSVISSTNLPKMYKLSKEKDIEITKDGGCKVMIYGKISKSLIVTQKSNQHLFPGYGIRFYDSATFRTNSSFLHTSTKQIRDLSLDPMEDSLLTVSLDKGAKLWNLQQRRVVSTFSPDDKVFWAAAFDCERPKYIYLGAQHGGITYMYDTRNPQSHLKELRTEGDASPVIKICPITARDDFPFGGFLVCKLNSVWFYELNAAQQTVATKLGVEGPFVSMNYEPETQHILISARPTISHPRSRYIIGELMKIDDSTSIRIWGTCLGSTVQSMMTRSTQIHVGEKNTIVAAYLEDIKSLTTWTAPKCSKMLSTALNDVVFDLCPMYINGKTYLSALTDNRCRIYQLRD